MIRALYAASSDGVQIDLIVRGACALRPGVPGLSENIRVRSILGRFLEHHRVWRFANAGEDDVWLSSADWMGRNLFRRIEVAFPVRDPELKARVIDEGLDVYLADTCDAWELNADGTWSLCQPKRGAKPRSAQANCWGGCARLRSSRSWPENRALTADGADGSDPVATCGSRAGRARSGPAPDCEGCQAGCARGRLARASSAGQLSRARLARTACAADRAGARTKVQDRPRILRRARASPRSWRRRTGPTRAKAC